jgi:hypothetical protein
MQSSFTFLGSDFDSGGRTEHAYKKIVPKKELPSLNVGSSSTA